MKKKILKTLNFIVMTVLTFALVLPVFKYEVSVWATTISDVKNQIKDTTNQLENINEKIDTLSDEQALLEEKIDDLNAEIINTMASIGMKEDEIALKEEAIENKQVEIDTTQKEYEAAKAREEKQQADMMVRVRRMYENGSMTYLNIFLTGDGLGDMLNRMDFIEKIYEYDRDKLTEYEETKNQVYALWEQLELEKTGLETEKAGLEADKATLQTQKTNLDSMLAQKKRESANFEAEIKKAKQEANVAKKLLQQEKMQLQQLQEAEKKKQQQLQQAESNKGNTTANSATGSNQSTASTGSSGNQAAADTGSTSNQSSAANTNFSSNSYTDIVDQAGGSDLGKKIAKYGLQYVGNPYVLGGTSLTNGADCSGFIYRIYSDFGYRLPRTSYEQRSAGTGVSYAEAQPGDIICYDGHVGLYIGGGKIVHASSARTGIKVSNATYRTILSVRRII